MSMKTYRAFLKISFLIFVVQLLPSCTTTDSDDEIINDTIQPEVIQGVVEEKEEPLQDSWYRICLWPNISSPTIYEVQDIYGISFGIATFGTEGKVQGLDIGLGASSDYVVGAKIAFVTKGRDTDGFVGGIFNIDKDVNGVQIGLGNEVEYMEWGCQIGLVNECKKHSEGYQFGIINIMKNGYFEVMPFFNFPRDESKFEQEAKYDDETW